MCVFHGFAFFYPQLMAVFLASYQGGDGAMFDFEHLDEAEASHSVGSFPLLPDMTYGE